MTEQRRSSLSVAARGLGIIAGLLVTSWVLDHLQIVRGESIHYSLVWQTTGVAERGDYVNLWVANPVIDPSGRRALLTKKVACAAGDTLRFDGMFFWCRSGDAPPRNLGGYVSSTWDGKPLQPFEFDGVIPPGEAFVIGEHPRSFDSRYFGLVQVADLQRVVGVL